MGQVLRQDKIGQLTHSAGNIIMAASVANPAYLTIGGRQYTVTNNLSVALPSMAANTRYQVFAVQSGGVVSLQISLNENSVGPAGFLSWKLVGSLYSNGLSPVGFGSFITIRGVPQTFNSIPFLPTLVGSGGAITAVGTLQGEWQRDGKEILVTCNAIFNGTPAAFTHTWFSFPGNLTPEFVSGSTQTTRGTGRFTDVSALTTYALHSHIFLDVSVWRIQARQLRTIGAAGTGVGDELISNTAPIATIASGDDLSVDAHAPVQQFSAIPIEDL